MPTDTRIPDNPFTDDSPAEDDNSSLSRAIQEHLDLKQRNAELDGAMPLDRYSVEDPFENHPLFKSEEQARLEETLDGVEAPEPVSPLPWPGDGRHRRGRRARRGSLGPLARLRLGRVATKQPGGHHALERRREAPERAVDPDQLVVRPALDDPPVLEHDDLVRTADGREAMGDDQ